MESNKKLTLLIADPIKIKNHLFRLLNVRLTCGLKLYYH